MMIRLVGAVLLVSGCGSFGFAMGLHYRREIRMLRQLLAALQEMEWELKYRLTPLPELCSTGAAATEGKLRELFQRLREALEAGEFSEISGCMNGLVQAMEISPKCAGCLRELGSSLGRYDLEGQLQGLRSVQERCRGFLEELESHRSERMRSYQTLWLCAGGALAILLV